MCIKQEICFSIPYLLENIIFYQYSSKYVQKKLTSLLYRIYKQQKAII
jgi:hypothetical protein